MATIIVVVAGAPHGPGRGAEGLPRFSPLCCCPHFTHGQTEARRGKGSTARLPGGGGTGLRRDFCLTAKPTPFPLGPADPVLGDWELKTIKYREKFHIHRDLDEKRGESERGRKIRGAAAGGARAGASEPAAVEMPLQGTVGAEWLHRDPKDIPGCPPTARSVQATDGAQLQAGPQQKCDVCLGEVGSDSVLCAQGSPGGRTQDTLL